MKRKMKWEIKSDKKCNETKDCMKWEMKWNEKKNEIVE